MFRFVSYFIILILLPLHLVYAQTTSTDVDESFDPFADYNEFEQQSEEEADINFLRNGRYLTLAFISGYRGFIGGGFAQAYKGNIDYGVEFSYFFDLQVAASLSYSIGDHSVYFRSFSDPGLTQFSQEYSGSVNIQMIDFHIKYFFNTDNITKGLADLNPYALVGTGYYIRSYSLSKIPVNSDPDKVVGFKLAAGIEIPLLKRRAYLGLQTTYRYVQFPDENNSFIQEGTDEEPQERPVSPRLDGDIFELNVILGMNF